MTDRGYVNLESRALEIEHKYGPNVHILSHPMAQSFLAKLSAPETHQPSLNYIVERLYGILLDTVVNSCFPREVVKMDTRMKEHHEKGVFHGEVIKASTPVVSVDLARAGIYPSHLCYHHLNFIMDPKVLRQDHFYIQRKTNAANEVVGVDLSGSKIGGPVKDAIVLFPDPMGATGGSMSHAISHYKNSVEGDALKYITMNLIITPEYIRRMQKDHPDVQIFALRLDRGLSSDKVLASVPGTFIDEEFGLNEHQYIVPGAGGVGEILNNSFV
ncbi:putative uracil phosphoribosyltransferase [Bacteriovorax sp. BSW11_IV]|uniref:uracil phosphoribosyltransferase n=1 Tax=Bacteriovorax sp. BSW11_IV TaxID=1353529 RepID=UPI000389F459|nr:uracil phosphoribosyltransferase [Bacteriovorax sp. BSW11_IV]EQC46732.1 putative uracil phosphoribosyltransferase [Bacteriovorax sp. BSW11_IV]